MQDEVQNSLLKRALGSAFATSNVLEFEPDVDVAVTALSARLTRDLTADLFRILQQFQCDFLMRAAFSEETLFLKNDEDVKNLSFQRRFEHWVRWQGLPTLEHWIYKTPGLRRFYISSRPPPWVTMALQKLQNRQDADKTPPKQDFLSKYIAGGEKHGDILDRETLMRIISSTISAGFDTTAFTMNAMLYYLMQNPSAMSALLQELQDANSKGELSTPPKYAETSKLPYLDAVMREAMRCYPFLTLPLERCVPAEGASVCGIWLPGGTSVGCHPTIVHGDRDCFGQDADCFKPERWLVSDATKRTAMDRAFLGFGSGKRICLGRHLAELEIKKAIPALLLGFKVSLLPLSFFLNYSSLTGRLSR